MQVSFFYENQIRIQWKIEGKQKDSIKFEYLIKTAAQWRFMYFEIENDKINTFHHSQLTAWKYEYIIKKLFAKD